MEERELSEALLPLLSWWSAEKAEEGFGIRLSGGTESIRSCASWALWNACMCVWGTYVIDLFERSGLSDAREEPTGDLNRSWKGHEI